MSFDMRAREALEFHPVVATNFGFVFINEASLKAVWKGSLSGTALGYRFGLLWPRQVYGRLVRELAAQGTEAVAFDVILGELRPDHAPIIVQETNLVDSDDFFAREMRQYGHVIIAVTKDVTPPALFATNALAVGDITTEKDSDGILRRVQILRPAWHQAFRQAATELDLDLDRARLEPGQVIVPHMRREGAQGADLKVPLDAEGNFDLQWFVGDKLPRGMARFNRPIAAQPIWHMGVLLAAQALQLDLSKAQVDLAHGRVTLHGPGCERIIPVDAHGYAYVDWCLPPEDPRLTKEAIEYLLLQDRLRQAGQTEELTNQWRGKLAVVGSSAQVGNNLTDRGATPLARDTLLVSKHWNVANSIITGRFIRRSPLWLDLALIMLLGIVAAAVTWQLGPFPALGLVALAAFGYVVFAVGLYVRARLWWPLALPVSGVLLQYLCVVTWKVVFEQAERRRVRSIFSRMLSPKIVNEVLQAETLSLGGARREITVLFADVRGFTQFTDTSQERVAEHVRKHNLTGAAAEACYAEQARETLETVNLYLGLIADIVKKQDGTLDKFIGDCVMAFWGAPTGNPRHALACVQAAIEAQRAIYALNQQRATENQKRELENAVRVAGGAAPLLMLPMLQLGSGINTGMATAGFMGSSEAEMSYTVFGREVNLASRLEGASGRGRIFISETTYAHLQRDDPALAATCVPQEAQKLKGFASAVHVYEVPWLPQGATPVQPEAPATALPDTTNVVKAGYGTATK